ncbi:hypothetical protein TRSC58_07462 [Trypanosoma rangeli SC58]|uniref:Uncharacterized protein n=1 Tax=Trypanosoma rangeli SC58 TaxID=429131 RepID=A0A061IRY6_TRYRA|nr:hypothetical protein TRSC58_07462 [Trypanosoma rangeli SC58]
MGEYRERERERARSAGGARVPHSPLPPSFLPFFPLPPVTHTHTHGMKPLLPSRLCPRRGNAAASRTWRQTHVMPKTNKDKTQKPNKTRRGRHQRKMTKKKYIFPHPSPCFFFLILVLLPQKKKKS